MHLLISIALITQILAANWLEINHLEGRFRVMAPGELTEQTDTVKTAIGDLVYHTFFHHSKEVKSENLFYMVSYCDYPEGIAFTNSTGFAEEFFASTMEQAAKAVHGKIVYSTDIQLDSYIGKHWRIDYQDGKTIIKTKAYLAANRYYAVQTVSYATKHINSAAERFFDSFRIL
jgi:hypothetical protein